VINLLEEDMKKLIPIFALLLFVIVSCSQTINEQTDIINNEFPEKQQELIEAVNAIVRDAETANLDGLRDIHLDSDKFTKFGPRSFERQNVQETNESELAFFGRVTNYKEEVKDLKVDVFGEVGIATYYREVSAEQDGEVSNASLRQTLVFVNTEEGWKLVHEHGNRQIQN
jgi:ketosteroid isomerase-like protein